MYEPSPENSPVSRSVSSCSNGGNTDESPVTQRESVRRVRRGPVPLQDGRSPEKDEYLLLTEGELDEKGE